MREFPPDSLIARLIELRLCTRADVQRAARRVRRMTRDLPAFDSVWIDGLVQSNVLTPFQARWLEHHPPETLRAGGYTVIDALSMASASQTFLARSAYRRCVVLKRLTLSDDELPAVELRLQLLVERARNCQTAHLAAATELVPVAGGIFVVSPYVAGLDLAQLLVRRGRFPALVVVNVLDQILSALSAWHATGAVHGDLRLSKLRLSDDGRIVLVDAGIRPALTPELIIHRVESPDEADVIAPERIGTNQSATAATDLYALGCVGWQLLTGRAPHLTADPLAKLAAHRTRRIPDVRELAPDTPAELAQLILQLTSPDPQQRPTSAEAARRLLGRRGPPRRGGLMRFRRQFDSAVPHLSVRKSSAARPWGTVSAAILTLGLCLVVLSDHGLRSELLHIATDGSGRLRGWSLGLPMSPPSQPTAPNPSRTNHRSSSSLLTIPAPNAQGVIELADSGAYRSRPITQTGPLVIQAGEGVRPVIVISEQTWDVSAERIVLQGIDVEWAGRAADSAPSALLHVWTQEIQITQCRMTGPPTNQDETEEFSAIQWEPGDLRDPHAGRIRFERVVLQGDMHGLACRTGPREVTFRQVLKLDGGSLLNIEEAPATRGLKLNLDQVTLRASGPLLTCAGPLTEHRSASLLEIEAVNSVFALQAASPLIELRGPAVRPDWPEAVRITGDGSLLPQQCVLLTHRDVESNLASVLESEEQEIDGLIVDAFEFAGELSADPRDSVLVKSLAPRRPETPMPGIDANQLP